MSISAIRSFLLGAYHDLPNVLFIGSLIFGSVTGYLPLVWMAMGMIMNSSAIAAIQALLKWIVPTWNQVSITNACHIFARVGSVRKEGVTVVAPSHWVASAVFFAVFTTYNGIRLMFRPAARGVSEQMVDVRRAFSYTVIITGLAFLLLILGRLFTGCETYLGMGTGLIIGAGSAIGFWHLLDRCGTGMVPDVHQIIGAMAPEGSGIEVPIVCTPPN